MSEMGAIEGSAGDAGDSRRVGVELAGHLNVLHAQLTAHMADLLATDGWRVGGKRTPNEYLIQWVGLSSHAARQVVTVAERRSSFPQMTALFDAGQFSLDQMAAAMRAPAWADDTDFVNLCRNLSVPRIQRLVREDRFVGDPDESQPSPAPPKDRVGFGMGRDGRWRLSANLNPLDGKRVEAALTERRDALFAEAADSEDADGDTDGTEDAQRVTWADALVDVAERSLDQVESRTRRDRFRTWVHIDVGTGAATTTDGWQIPMVLADEIGCDGVVQPVWERDGVPFSVGRAQHIVPDRTRRIVERRDRGCCVPGCSNDRFLEVHHIIHWSEGGPTSTWNLCALWRVHDLGQRRSDRRARVPRRRGPGDRRQRTTGHADRIRTITERALLHPGQRAHGLALADGLGTPQRNQTPPRTDRVVARRRRLTQSLFDTRTVREPNPAPLASRLMDAATRVIGRSVSNGRVWTNMPVLGDDVVLPKPTVRTITGDTRRFVNETSVGQRVLGEERLAADAIERRRDAAAAPPSSGGVGEGNEVPADD